MRKRFWLEIVASLSIALFFAVTVWWPNWLESCFGIDLDGGNGSLERSLVFCSAVAALVFLALSGLELKRTLSIRAVRS
jgi:hypothetical protein